MHKIGLTFDNFEFIVRSERGFGMPEKDNKELFGEVSQIQSSDSFIEGQLKALKSDNYGLNNQIIEVSGDDLLNPLAFGSSETDVEVDESSRDKILDLSKLTCNHSAFGAKVQELRKIKKQSKKAA